MMGAKYLTENHLPTILCCEIEYDWDEKEEACLMCGEVFDWDDCSEHWDEQVLMEHQIEIEDQDPSWGIYDPAEDPDYDPSASAFERWKTAVEKGESYFEKDEEPTLFADKAFYHSKPAGVDRWGNIGAGTKGWPEPRSRKETTPSVDPFLDYDMPNEIL